MGGWRDQSDEYVKKLAEQRAEENARLAKAVQDARKKLAKKIVMKVVDDIVADIIRPGPIAEERECYDMAAELRDLAPNLEIIVTEIININKGVE